MDVANACDESKCVSKGGSNLVDGSFTCWGDDDIFPRMCADGFLPVVVDSESTIEVDVGGLALTDLPLYYFTCCPPAIEKNLTSEETTRQCSDPKAIDDDEMMECDSEETRKYPRQMKPMWDDVSETEKTYFSCCDLFNSTENSYNNTAISSELNFLDDTECVPYRDEFYDAAQVKNNIGTLRRRICDIPEGNFTVPVPFGDGTENALGEHRYQCCKTGDALQPFITDTSFYITVYPGLFLYLIAAVISVIVFLGLLIPLVKQLKNGSYARASLVSQSSRRGGKRYSTYNLYLVYLALLDLCYCMFHIVRFASAADQQVYPSFYSWLMESESSGRQSLTPYSLFSTCYTLANMWINAIICYELWMLLKSSQQHKKRTSPSLTQVNLECGSVVLLLIIIAISFHYTNELSGLDIEASLIKCLVALTYIPFVYVVCITIAIWWKGYISSLARTSANETGLRQLALYFLRIVGVFVVIWIPTSLVVVLLYFGVNIGYSGMMVSFWLIGLQPIITFCMILTKEDAKKYIFDLVTFTYCRKQKPLSSFDNHPSHARNVSSLKCTSDSIKNYSNLDSSLNHKSSTSSGGTPFGERSTRETPFIGNDSSMVPMEDGDSDEEENESSALGEQC